MVHVVGEPVNTLFTLLTNCIVDGEPVNPCTLLTASELERKSFISSQRVCSVLNIKISGLNNYFLVRCLQCLGTVDWAAERS